MKQKKNQNPYLGISVDEQQQEQNDHKSKKKKKEGEEEDDFENTNQSVMPSITKPRRRFIDKIKKKPKSPSSVDGSRKGGFFSGIRPSRRRRRRRGREEGEDECESPTSDPNVERFSHEMLRVVLETNDFCSDDCNAHRVLLSFIGVEAHTLATLLKQGMVKKGEEVAIVHSGSQPIWRSQSTHNIQVPKV